MLALLTGVLVASVLGSLHCAGMCGAFVALASSPAPRRPGAGGGCGAACSLPQPVTLGGRVVSGGASHAACQGAYHLGRLCTYLALGAAAGTLGAAIDGGGVLLGVQRAAAVLAGITLVGAGVVTLARLLGARVPKAMVPDGVALVIARVYARAGALPAVARAGVIGLATTLLPCGWLYMFLVTAAGTGDALHAMAVMATFWLGTLPVLVSAGAGARMVASRLGARAPAIAAVLLIAVGVLGLTGRLPLIGVVTPESVAAQVRVREAAHRVDQAAATEDEPSAVPIPSPSTEAACCHGH